MFRKKLILILFTFSVLNVFPKQFSYQFAEEVVYKDYPGFELSANIKQFANYLNCYLNSSVLFDTKFLKDIGAVRSYLLDDKKHNPKCDGKLYSSIKTEDGAELQATFFDRHSDKLMVICQGFGDPREWMAPFLEIFPDYDVVLFDFRGKGYIPSKWWNPCSWNIFNPIQSSLNLDRKIVTIGRLEEKDVAAIVTFFKNQNNKKYTKVFGLGPCYGAFILFKTILFYPGMFDRVILDSCPLSINSYLENIKNNSDQLSGVDKQGCWGKIMSSDKMKNAFEFVEKNIVLPQLKNVADLSIQEFVKKYKQANGKTTSILFFYSKNDCEVLREDFEAVWQLVPNDFEKTAIINSNFHVLSHYKQKELYKFICDLFLEKPQQDFINCLCDVNLAMEFFAERLKNWLK